MAVRDLDYLKATVKHAGLSNRQLASEAGVGYGTVANLLSGGRFGCSDAVARAISDALRTDIELLFTRRPYRATSEKVA